MTTLVGLAFTSPAIASTVIDRDTFRVHYYKQRPDALRSFLQEDDSRLPIVLLSSVQDLKRLENVEGVHAFLLSEDPRVLSEIDGADILDAIPAKRHEGYDIVSISTDDINDALAKSGSFVFTSASLSALGELSAGIAFRELVKSVTAGYTLPDGYTESICMYLVRALQRRSWVSRVQKVGLAAGVPVAKMAELEKYIDVSPSSDLLWRAYYDHVENNVPVADVVSQFEVDKRDIEYLVTVLGSSELRYTKLPSSSPVVLKKKRKVRKLKAAGTHGTSLKNSSKKRDEASPKESLSTWLAAVDRTLDGKEESPSMFSRLACSFIVGLATKKVFSAACRSAVSNGAPKGVVKKIIMFSRSQEAHALHQAYRKYVCDVGVTASDVSGLCGVPPSDLKTVLRYKPLGLKISGLFSGWSVSS